MVEDIVVAVDAIDMEEVAATDGEEAAVIDMEEADIEEAAVMSATNMVVVITAVKISKVYYYFEN